MDESRKGSWFMVAGRMTFGARVVETVQGTRKGNVEAALSVVYEF
jgi:hypothetical protein